MFDDNIYAALVFDGQQLTVPSERMGVPRDDQLQGTNLERLSELAGRVCYDSLGKGRNSAEYHDHIATVNHLSVYEHATFTVAFREDPARLIDVVGQEPARWPDGVVEEPERLVDVVRSLPPDPDFYHRLLPALIGRPGVWCETAKGHGFKALRVTCNLRAVLEWTDWVPHVESYWVVVQYLGWALSAFAHKLAPQVVDDPGVFDPEFAQHCPYLATLVTNNPKEPQWHNEDERWVSLFLGMSRGCSHELVRHGDFTAISQRSTRYVDESESPWVEHPLLSKARPDLDHPTLPLTDVPVGESESVPLQTLASRLYAATVIKLESWGAKRKQARGAARGFLGNALYTEVIFSANVAQWKRMLRQRCSNPADAEIRVLFARALPQLQRSQHGECFREFRLVPAEDGIGEVVAGG
jgi:thymidylate synthase (FAD)